MPQVRKNMWSLIRPINLQADGVAARTPITYCFDCRASNTVAACPSQPPGITTTPNDIPQLADIIPLPYIVLEVAGQIFPVGTLDTIGIDGFLNEEHAISIGTKRNLMVNNSIPYEYVEVIQPSIPIVIHISEPPPRAAIHRPLSSGVQVNRFMPITTFHMKSIMVDGVLDKGKGLDKQWTQISPCKWRSTHI